MTDQLDKNQKRPAQKRSSRSASAPAPRLVAAPDVSPAHATLCWPFPPGSQNDTDKAVKLKPYVPPKRRTLNQY